MYIFFNQNIKDIDVAIFKIVRGISLIINKRIFLNHEIQMVKIIN